MKELKVKGIVIKAIDYKDSDKLVTIFSAELGLIKARVRGVKKDKAKLAFAVQPFAFIEFVLFDNNSFYTVKTATSVDQFFNITLDFDTYILMLATLELAEKTIKENNPEPELFMLIISTLKSVAYENASPMIAFIKFMIEALKHLGYNLEIDCCSICGDKLSEKIFPFSYEFNGMLCAKCSNKNEYLELTKGEYLILKNINFTDMSKLSNLKFMSRNDLVSIISLLCKNFRLMTDEELITIKQFL